MRSLNIVFTFFIFMFFSATMYAWDGHMLLTYAALKNMPEVSEEATISAEPLTDFLQKERAGIAALLAENEQWANEHIKYYPPLPENLVFKSTGDTTPIETAFSHALRINPNLKFPLFAQYPPGITHRIHATALERTQLMLGLIADSAWIHTPNLPIEAVVPGETLSPLEILTSSADEPDFGMDTDLWENNQGDVGKLYLWGNQPFGTPTFSLSTQTPFHVGFYYERTMLYKLSSLEKTYAEYRIHLYLALSRFAFKTNHPYWGYRFLSWALHYGQDLAQPYHAKVAPGFSTTRILLINLIDGIGIHSPYRKLVQLLSNRHFSLENYQYYAFEAAFKRNQPDNVLIKAINNIGNDQHYPAYTDDYPRNTIAKDASDMADEVNTHIRKTIPEKYVDDPEYIFYTTDLLPPNLYTLVQQQSPKAASQLNNQLIPLLVGVGAHTRNMIRYGLKK